MRAPCLPPDHPDRLLELEEAMDRSVAEIMESALDAGWSVEEIEKAAQSLAVNFRLRIEANAETERQISEASKLKAN